ncbi:hypothetical protein CTAYLR_004874 [Chrysophaeum taylorii]|uniref:Sulfotransferase domain-containing protein n=1 Tax=Chrysophaeum taylorii TaxID=2483200 RepID=A0AAD7XPG7_9STRA|nr:hypothetical protein CTAYLR_004874 [Chrysophaeum taylorii]
MGILWSVMLFGFGRGEDGYHCVSLEIRAGSRLACGRGELPSGSQRWPNVLGIGPAKSGSTALAHLLHSVPRVVTGNKTYATGVWEDYPYEVAWLYRPEMVAKGLASYSKYFPPNENAVVFFEKTPKYSAHSLVPYRARTFLSNKLKLVLTTRGLLDLDASLYLYREKLVTYREWFEARVRAHEAWADCRERRFRVITGNTITIESLHDPDYFDWQAASGAEHDLANVCGAVASVDANVTRFRDWISEIFVVWSLRRWTLVFPHEQNFLCIDSDSIKANPEMEQSRIFDFVGLPDQKYVPAAKKVLKATRTPTDRLVDVQIAKGVPEDDVPLLQKALLDWGRARTRCRDVDAFKRVCGYVPSDHDHCSS